MFTSKYLEQEWWRAQQCVKVQVAGVDTITAQWRISYRRIACR